MIDQRILQKIKKCLALANSSNEHEAKVALERAQVLMKKHGITSEQVALADVRTDERKGQSVDNPPNYYQMLVGLMGYAFGVQCVYKRSAARGAATVEFIGIQYQAELAGYAYEVLFRQLTKDRNDYIKTLKRFKRANKIRKADIFAEHWVAAVASKLSKFTQAPEHQELITQYKQQKYQSGLSKLKEREHEYKAGDGNAAIKGRKAGRNATLNHGVNGQETAKLESCHG